MQAVAEAPIRLGRGRGEPALDDLIARVWEELTAHRDVACPLCAGELAPEYGAQARPIRGRCTTCGTTLS